jgi:hypothetical protein
VSWRIAIRHRTGYHYSGRGATSSYNEVRITPLTTDRQTVIEATVNISPAVPTLRYIDYWGTYVDAFDVQEPHTDMVVTGTSVVDTSTMPEPVTGFEWDDLARDDVRDRYAELLAPTLRVPNHRRGGRGGPKLGERPLPRRRLLRGDGVGAQPASL